MTSLSSCLSCVAVWTPLTSSRASLSGRGTCVELIPKSLPELVARRYSAALAALRLQIPECSARAGQDILLRTFLSELQRFIVVVVFSKVLLALGNVLHVIFIHILFILTDFVRLIFNFARVPSSSFLVSRLALLVPHSVLKQNFFRVHCFIQRNL